jgi:acetyl esterase/lipase
MLAWLIKIYMSIIEFLGRLFIFNRNLPTGFDLTRNIKYSDSCRLDLFRPSGNDDELPVLVYIHGGGWTTGSKLTSTRQCAIIALEGFIVLNIQYRLGPRHIHPAQMEDIAMALEWLNKNKTKLKADTGRIFFGGSSAGAHLSCMAACMATNEELRDSIGIEIPIDGNQISGVLLVSGGYNMDTIVNSGFFMIRTMVKSYCGARNPAESPLKDQISPIHHIKQGFPPAFVTASEYDRLFGQTLELMQVFKEKGIEHKELLFRRNGKKAKHAFLHFYYRDCSKKAYEGIKEFLAEHS